MSIERNDSAVSGAGVPAHMPPGTVQTRTGLVIGRAYVPHPKWDSRPDHEAIQRALLHRERSDGGWRSVATAVILGAALAAAMFLTLSN